METASVQSVPAQTKSQRAIRIFFFFVLAISCAVIAAEIWFMAHPAGISPPQPLGSLESHGVFVFLLLAIPIVAAYLATAKAPKYRPLAVIFGVFLMAVYVNDAVQSVLQSMDSQVYWRTTGPGGKYLMIPVIMEIGFPLIYAPVNILLIVLFTQRVRERSSRKLMALAVLAVILALSFLPSLQNRSRSHDELYYYTCPPGGAAEYHPPGFKCAETDEVTH
jgi:hypothetical protein